jgi:hypothetical protein
VSDGGGVTDGVVMTDGSATDVVVVSDGGGVTDAVVVTDGGGGSDAGPADGGGCPAIACAAPPAGACAGQALDEDTCSCVPIQLANGTPCACGGLCDAGVCTIAPAGGGCLTTADCPPPSDGCHAATCQDCACGAELITNCTPCVSGDDCGACGACASDGTCFLAPVEDAATCLLNACDDGNACTIDSCNKAGCGGCVHKPLPGCEPCANASACDDGDPCTDDLCVGAPDSLCHHVPSETAQCLLCAPGAYQTAAVVNALATGEAVQTAGEARPDIKPDKDCAACAGDACPCDSCLGRVRLMDAAANFVAVEQTGVPWRCHNSTICPATPVACEPVHAGVSYWVGGTKADAPPDAPPTPNGAPAPGPVMVDWWCLQMTASNLVGSYSGDVWSAADHNTRVQVTAALYSLGGGALGGTITSTSVDGNPAISFPSNQLQNVTLAGGKLTFTLVIRIKVWLSDVDVTAEFAVFGEENRLVGTWLGTGTALGTQYEIPGYLDLTRQP